MERDHFEEIYIDPKIEDPSEVFLDNFRDSSLDFFPTKIHFSK
jgi:hypothetical protein